MDNKMPVPAYGGFGHETSRAYADGHEQHLYAEIALRVQKGEAVRVLDLACGMGVTSRRLAEAGATVTAVDLNPDTAQALHESPRATRIDFHQADIRALPPAVAAQRYDYILFQRALDCMPVDDGKKVLRQLQSLLKQEGRLYMTVSSLSADYAEGYSGKAQPLSRRFAPLAPRFQAEHHFFQPICMYGKDELAGLMKKQHWQIDELFLSSGGSNKVIASRQSGRGRWAAAAFAAAAVLALCARNRRPAAESVTDPAALIAGLGGDYTDLAVCKLGSSGEKTVFATKPEWFDREYLQGSYELGTSRWHLNRAEITANGQTYVIYARPDIGFAERQKKQLAASL